MCLSSATGKDEKPMLSNISSAPWHVLRKSPERYICSRRPIRIGDWLPRLWVKFLWRLISCGKQRGYIRKSEEMILLSPSYRYGQGHGVHFLRIVLRRSSSMLYKEGKHV